MPLRFRFRIETAAVIIPLKRSGLPFIVPSILSTEERFEVGQAYYKMISARWVMRYDCSSPQALRQRRGDRDRDRRLRTSPKMPAVVRQDPRAKSLSWREM